jgi:hypothetical protein
MDRIIPILRMINDTEEKDFLFIQEEYTFLTFLLAKHIQDKIGKETYTGHCPRKAGNRDLMHKKK